MKVLLPPSETKRPGGSGAPLRLDALALSSLLDQRLAVTRALVTLAGDPAEAQRVLKLSDRQVGDIEHNRMLFDAPTMPAVDRYTGVLFDALDAATLDEQSRAWLGRQVLIHSAPFGPVSALDEIPPYRLAAGIALPGVPPLRRFWAEPTSAALADAGFLLDLRSEAYVALGPVPDGAESAYIRVVTAAGRALNHFNKKAKGELVRALATTGAVITGTSDLLAWAEHNDVILRASDVPRVWELVVTA
ncbi:YaaA family protein [Microbacterium sp. 2216-1]|uniref:YaaA family protein n=1 Tax=Microbacterium TaxID=33882 RepID=UPI001CD58952|nr:peroxide stress protein YaaA [Microbacterium esteraromaticum]MCA1305974.1 peroxide stress protein YaaA [Microbacterium esteraromaticum]